MNKSRGFIAECHWLCQTLSIYFVFVNKEHKIDHDFTCTSAKVDWLWLRINSESRAFFFNKGEFINDVIQFWFKIAFPPPIRNVKISVLPSHSLRVLQK